MTAGTPHTEQNVRNALGWAKLGGDLNSLTRTEKHRRYRRVSRAVWIDRQAATDVGTLAIAHSLAVPQSVIGGWSAAEIHGLSAPGGALPELIVGPGFKKRRGVVLRRTSVPKPGLLQIGTVALTEPNFTAFEIARFGATHVDAVIALEQLARDGLDLDGLHDILRHFRGRWGVSRVRRALEDVDLLSESAKETELRLFIKGAGISGFESQVVIPELGYRLDLANRAALVAVEYDGIHHRSSTQQVKDAQRRNRLQAHGWTIITVTWLQLRENPGEVLAQIRKALLRAGVAV